MLRSVTLVADLEGMGRERKYVGLHRKDGTPIGQRDWSPDPAHIVALNAPHRLVVLWRWDEPWARDWIVRLALLQILVACLIVALAHG